MEWKWKSLSRVWLFATPWLQSPWNSLGQSTGVGSFSRLRGIFPTQGSNPGLPHHRWIIYQLSHKGSPRRLEWVAYSSSSGSSRSRNWTRVSLRVGHDWATSLSLFTFMHWRRKWQTTPVFLPGGSQGWGSLMGCHLWGRTESETTEAT